MDINIVGPYPPPYGGVSVHIQRIVWFLSRENISYKVFNQYSNACPESFIESTSGSYFWWLWYLFLCKARLVHFHFYSIFHFPYIFIFSWIRKNKVVVTIHNEKLLNYPLPLQCVLIYLLKYSRVSRIICASESVKSVLVDSGVKHVDWLPAYVPPVIKFPDGVNKQVGRGFAFNAWRILNEDDVYKYGLDLYIYLSSKFDDRFDIYIGDESSRCFVNEYLGRQKFIGAVCVYYGSSLVEQLGEYKFFFRLNREDAFGVSIQEALDLGVPSIASDVCRRPSGAIIYRSGDISDLTDTLARCLVSSRDELLIGREKTDYHRRLISIYRNELGL